jgi:hypothetical protein
VARSFSNAMFSETPDRSELDRPKPVWSGPNFYFLTFSGLHALSAACLNL